MNQDDGFYTMKGYERNGEPEMSSAMEDYLEMITRLYQEQDVVRVTDLSRMLHVKPSSVTKMVQQLKVSGYIHCQKYGDIFLTEKGREAGRYLLFRHDVLHRFLCALNHSEDELEQVEKIEHFLNRDTIENLEHLTARMTEKQRRN